MTDPDFSFFTIKNSVSDLLLREKGSKFIGFAFPVKSEEDVRRELSALREIHPKATHHCYAYRLGRLGENYRANDDGEPSGSAALPMYNQLLAHEVTNVLVVAVRYYGGTKLGVSGLIKMYKETAKETLENAEIILQELESKLIVEFDYAQQNVIFTLLGRYSAKIDDFSTAERCTIQSTLKTAHKESISTELAEMQNVYFTIE